MKLLAKTHNFLTNKHYTIEGSENDNTILITEINSKDNIKITQFQGTTYAEIKVIELLDIEDIKNSIIRFSYYINKYLYNDENKLEQLIDALNPIRYISDSTVIEFNI